MQVSFDKSQLSSPRKAKNILIRSFNKYRRPWNPSHSETSHILKYSPKYYQSLALEIRPYSPLLSKIKKIKKLKKLEGETGTSFKKPFPQSLWFNLLANSRKEIEEALQIHLYNFDVKMSRLFWRRVNLQRFKFFSNMTGVSVSKWRIHQWWSDPDPLLAIPRLFVHSIRNLRKLRTLEIFVGEDNYAQAKWVLERLDGMKILLKRLETFILDIKVQDRNVKDLLQNKNLFPNLTDLSLLVLFDPCFVELPHICKGLRSLSLQFLNHVGEKSEHLDFFTSMQDLKQLKSLQLVWPREARNFWSHFKPQPSIQQLTLRLSVSDLIKEGLFGENVEPKDVVAHWEDILELDVLTFHVTCHLVKDIVFARQFITMILKKVRKVRSLKYSMRSTAIHDEPFFVEEVPHLYESLERFDHHFTNFARYLSPSRFDLKMMKPFRSLKELNLDGRGVAYENIEEVVSLMEENQKEGDKAPALKIKSDLMVDQFWLGKTLKKIDSVKRDDKKVEMLFNLRFLMQEDLVDQLEGLCKDIQAVKPIKGLVISLVLDHNVDPLPVEALKEVLNKYNEIRNLKLLMSNGHAFLRYSRLDGEKEQFDMSQ